MSANKFIVPPVTKAPSAVPEKYLRPYESMTQAEVVEATRYLMTLEELKTHPERSRVSKFLRVGAPA
jgi:hypothetical protein